MYNGGLPPASSLNSMRAFGKDPADRGLRSIVGGSLQQLSLSLERLPASRTHALPSHEARALLRSVGFRDPAAPDVSSLHRQPGDGFGGMGGAGTDGSERADGEGGGAVEYSELSGAVIERVARLARLHTDNFLRSELERDWEEERAGLIGGADYSSKGLKRDGDVASGQGGTAGRRGGAVCSPVAGFADREFARWHRDGGAGLEHLEHRSVPSQPCLPPAHHKSLVTSLSPDLPPASHLHSLPFALPSFLLSGIRLSHALTRRSSHHWG
eukprot:2539056-Rhodomonas_salina.2